MVLFAAFFDTEFQGKAYSLKDRYLKHFRDAFPEHEKQLGKTKNCVAYFVRKENAGKAAFSLSLNAFDIGESEIRIKLSPGKRLSVSSGAVAKQMLKTARQSGWVNESGMAPLVCIIPKKEACALLKRIQNAEKLEKMLSEKDYKGICMMYAPLSDAKKKPEIWDDADVLYALGLSCSKLSVTLLVKAGEKEKLAKKAKYRAFCVAFLERGAVIEQDNARFATALAYRYYSNVHELMRPGERRDSNLEEEIEKANEWLSKAIEMNPQSIRNNYRKGKLIIEKQAPYLLFGKKAFGQGEAKLLREIRQVGEEHLATAISLYEALSDERQKMTNKREYAKALFTLGKHYLNDANLPVHEYCARMLVGDGGKTEIEKISKLNLESARGLLEKCFAAETDMQLASLDVVALASQVKEWTRTPIEKLYLIGCVYGASAFVLVAEGCVQKAELLARKAISLLSSAKSVADKCTDRKRNTWHISEKIAWGYIYLGKYEKAAKLLSRAKAGYIKNTYALALLLAGTEEAKTQAAVVLKSAAADKNNLALSRSRILYAYTQKNEGKDADIGGELSEKNAKLARILGVAGKRD